ncbi:MAG: twin-arginine translocase TatA/TatE family subunit [Verrucomicrobia bacterium]|nr:twin-arginine translocase TatA/TatE family subunit [Verrucomicrobiota bacterium]
MLNGYEIILILTLALIFFGAKKLPELARGLGQGIREFRKASREVTSEVETMMESEPYAPPREIPPPAPEAEPVTQGAAASAPQETSARHEG